MSKFILGFPADSDCIQENLIEYKTKKDADCNSEEWCEIEADSLEQAKQKYEKSFLDWQKINQKFNKE